MKPSRPLLFIALLCASSLALAQEDAARPIPRPRPPPLVVAPEDDAPAPEDRPPRTRVAVTEGALPSLEAAPPAKDPVPRVAVELLGGTAGGVVGATVLGSFGYLLGSATVGCDECVLMAYAGAAAGVLIGVPAGTYAGGRFMGSRGRLGATVAGSFVGWGVTLLGITLLNSGPSDPPPALNAALFLLPVVGATAGLELAHGSAVRQEAAQAAARRDSGVRLLPLATYGERGPRLGLAGRF